MAEEVKLLGCWASPFSRRIELALELKDVQYEYVEEDLLNKSHQLLEYNPIHKKVPVLIHNGKPIPESPVILEYIDEAFAGNPIFPQDPYEKAMARFWTKFVDDKCVPALWTACWAEGEDQKKYMEEACQHLKTLEDELKDKKFFGGDTIGPVDIAAIFIAFWHGAVEEINGVHFLTGEKFPKLYNWSVEFINCSIVKKHLPPREIYIADLKARHSKNISYLHR